jgi:hypothetical protein
MAAVAPLQQPQRRDRPSRRPPLRLAPAPRPRLSRYADGVWAATLALLLGIGILGVLLLNTSTQTQADRIAAAKGRLADLTLHAQVLQMAADQQDAPSVLAERARALHMRPATRVTVTAAQRTRTGKVVRPRKLIRPFHTG